LWVVRTDKDIGDGPLAGLLQQVILQFVTVLPLIESVQSIINERQYMRPQDRDNINTDSKMTVSASEYLSFRSVLAFFEYGHQLLENTTTAFSATAFCSHAY